MPTIRKVLFATDFSEASDAALQYAATMAGLSTRAARAARARGSRRARLDHRGLRCGPARRARGDGAPGAGAPGAVAHARTARRRAGASLVLRTGSPFVEVVRYARDEAMDLIVLGTHGRGAIAHMLLGSVAERVVRKAHCPVRHGPAAGARRSSCRRSAEADDILRPLRMRFAPEYVTTSSTTTSRTRRRCSWSPSWRSTTRTSSCSPSRASSRRATRTRLRRALDGISQTDVRKVRYDGTCEDLFFYVERLIETACGPDVAGRLHTARSRNDIDMTMYRMRQRVRLLELVEARQRAARARSSRSPSGTARRCSRRTPTRSRRRPRPWRTTCSAAIEQIGRDVAAAAGGLPDDQPESAGRLCDHRDRASRSTGTGPRNCSGSTGPTGNTYGSIATIDYTLEGLSSTAVLLVGLGRLLQDLLLWCTMEFGYLRLPDGYVQGSSIMPQKRNPVALEHARAISSKALGPGDGRDDRGAQHAVR